MRENPGVKRLARLGLVVLASAAGTADAAVPPGGPPFDLAVDPGHRVSLTVDTAPARDVLAVLAGGAEAPPTLKRLRSSPAALHAISAGSLPAEDFFGRLVSAAAGAPDPLLESFRSNAKAYGNLLSGIEAEATMLALVESRRLAYLLPKTPVVAERYRIVPFFGVSGFAEVTLVRAEDEAVLVADLPRLVGDVTTASPREVLLKMLREASSETWRDLFATHVRRAPAWPDGKSADLDALLARTVAEGVATLFLFPDEFFPIASLLGEPIQRSFNRWGLAIEALTDPKQTETRRSEILADSTKGEFWGRYAAIVGAQLADAGLREGGREAFVTALASGPRAVVALYLSVAKEGRYPQVSKPARKILEKPPAPPATATATAGTR